MARSVVERPAGEPPREWWRLTWSGFMRIFAVCVPWLIGIAVLSAVLSAVLPTVLSTVVTNTSVGGAGPVVVTAGAAEEKLELGVRS